MRRHTLPVVALFLISVCVAVPPLMAAKPLDPSLRRPDSIVSEQKNNVFLKASDQQFRPVAEFMMNKNLRATEAVFVAVTVENVRHIKGHVAWTDQEYIFYREECVRELERDVRPIARASGILDKNKSAFQDKGHHIFDPRVYERAKKMMGKAPPAKLKN